MFAGYFFLVVSTGQMAIWAAKKHKQYKIDFGADYQKLGRKKMFPFLWYEPILSQSRSINRSDTAVCVCAGKFNCGW